MAGGWNGETSAPAHDFMAAGFPANAPAGRRPEGGEPQTIGYQRSALARRGRAHGIKTGDLFFEGSTRYKIYTCSSVLAPCQIATRKR